VDEPCSLDSDCAQGERCAQDGACTFVGPIDCQSNDDCGLRWTCDQGTCSDLSCEDSAGCAPEAWCNASVCERRSTALLPFGLRRVELGALTQRRAYDVLDNLGFGGGLFDMDGDGDLDLFVGDSRRSAPSAPCVLRNTSAPGRLSFEPAEGLCDDPRLAGGFAGWAMDLDRDGADELIMVGKGTVKLLRATPQVEVTDLAGPLGELGARCYAGSALPIDLDWDGFLDLVVGCQGIEAPEQVNLVWRYDPDAGALLFDEDEAWRDMDERGIDLGLGVLDVDQDGLLDVIAVNDTFSTRDTPPDLPLPSGGVWRRCPPTERCVGQLWRYGQGNAESGSFMGAGNVWVDGLGEHLYLSDWGPNRLLAFTPDGAVRDNAPGLGVDQGFADGILVFSWGVVVEDLDRNGLDDLLVAQGMQPPVLDNNPDAPQELYRQSLPSFPKHHDQLLLQTEGGAFEAAGEARGLQPHSLADSGDDERVSASRGAVKADLDLDGHLEILLGALEGHLRLYSEEPTTTGDPPRCTLIPRPRVVPAVGYGYAVADPAMARWRRRDIQGQHRFGASPWVLSDLNQGFFRFPSGAVVAFDCDNTPGPLVVEEPDWVRVERQGPDLLVTFPDLAPTTLEAHVRTPQGAYRAAVQPQPDGWLVQDIPQGEAVMLKLDGRWLQRWWR
jgi:hypothetical protein